MYSDESTHSIFTKRFSQVINAKDFTDYRLGFFLRNFSPGMPMGRQDTGESMRSTAGVRNGVLSSRLNETKIEMMPTVISEAEEYEKESLSLGGGRSRGSGLSEGILGMSKGREDGKGEGVAFGGAGKNFDIGEK